jgi:tRNA (guanine37-N1)-methyltransferase
MNFDLITIFPKMFDSPLDESIVKKAKEKGLVHISVHDLRDYAEGKHRVTDDYPYGGGEGMVMKADPIIRAVKAVKDKRRDAKTILLTPQGEILNQAVIKELSEEKSLIIICGRYEGVDERIRLHYVDREISIGDYVLTGGELPAMVLIDAIARLIPGVVGNENSVKNDSFYSYLLGYPQYTRPSEIEGKTVPEVLLSGDHEKIRTWRRKEALRQTLKKRPDLLKSMKLTKEDKSILKEIDTVHERNN